MAITTRFDLKMDAAEKQLVARAADLMGTTMADFVRTAAKEKAMTLLDRESRVTLSQRDFAAVTKALENAFAPNKALRGALRQAEKSAVLEEHPLDQATQPQLTSGNVTAMKQAKASALAIAPTAGCPVRRNAQPLKQP
jgi:uncharacterized protein (DUF1778 family)